jgi:hypothetical protein
MFDNEQIRLMSKALDHAWAAVQASRSNYAMGDEAERVRTALAKSIVAAARDGELDPHRLSLGAQAALAAAQDPVRKLEAEAARLDAAR